ncbi:MAG: sigma-54-dependent Fis family transcriptional regulator [Alphaproteobacteria bacterium]|nr:sigma-54-dependent Fis family transcriptional regulator [Alphaproteobacteria bacterium]
MLRPAGALMDAEPKPRLLLVEDDPIVRGTVARTLGRMGYDVHPAADAVEALELAVEHPPDVALIDIGLPDGRSGIDVMRELKQRDGAVECLIFTGDASAGVALEAYDAGAVEFFEKPITDWNRFHTVLRRAARLARLTRENEALSGRSEVGDILRRFLVGSSRSMENLRAQVERLAPRNVHVLLLGPTGAGKTRVAQALHAASGRRGPLEVVNLAGLNKHTIQAELYGYEAGAFTGAAGRHKGAFERTADGTIVLDEIGDLDPDEQKVLLHVLEDRRFQRMMGTTALPMTSRVVACTHQDMDAMVQQGRFRADLANRLGIRVEVPGLDARREDIPQLIYLFLNAVNEREGLSVRHVPTEVIERLSHADWSGENLRGLRTAVERMVIFAKGDALDPEDLPADRQAPVVAAPGADDGALPEAWQQLAYRDFKEAVLAEYVGRYVRSLLEQTGGNVSAAARIADLHGPNFRRLMNRFGIDG